jgi:hypothetical protein
MKRYIICLLLIANVFAINMEAAVQHLISHALPKSESWCAKYVANALEAGGFKFTRQSAAYMYHTNGILRKMGYSEIGKQNSYKKGDITVTERNGSYPYGHIAMWSGSNWISDFVQKSEFVYGRNQPPVHYYRYGGKTDDEPGPEPSGLVFTYAVRTAEGKILPEVTNTNDYAGKRGVAITDLAVKVNRGSVKYRVHVQGGGWLGYVTGYNWNDRNNGYAGNGKPIDLVQIIYNGNNNLPSYRVSPINANYYSWQKGNVVASGLDGYAGAQGKVIDRIQITS